MVVKWILMHFMKLTFSVIQAKVCKNIPTHLHLPVGPVHENFCSPDITFIRLGERTAIVVLQAKLHTKLSGHCVNVNRKKRWCVWKYIFNKQLVNINISLLHTFPNFFTIKFWQKATKVYYSKCKGVKWKVQHTICDVKLIEGNVHETHIGQSCKSINFMSKLWQIQL